jgi:MYXO-CTERM domain-containing protein
MRSRLILLAMALAAVGLAPATPISVDLKSAASFGLLGGTISNTGTSVVVGNVGATTTVTGFPPGTATGIVYPFPTDPTVMQAYQDFLNAYTLASGLSSTASFGDLTTSFTFNGNNVYTSAQTDISSTAGIHLTFDAANDVNEVFIIKITRDLTINGPITFTLQNGAQAHNIYWIVGRTETIDPVGVPVTWDGNILAGTSFTMSSIGPSSALGGTINGCVFARTANTLAGTTDVNGCSSSAASTPEPGSAALVGFGSLLGILRWRRQRTNRASN